MLHDFKQKSLAEESKTVERLTQALFGCLQQESLCVVHLFVIGESANLDGPQDLGPSGIEPDDSFLAALFHKIPCPVVGMAAGHIGKLGTSLLASCDEVIAVRGSEFTFGAKHKPRTSVSTAQAMQVGLVKLSVNNGEELLALSETHVESLRGQPEHYILELKQKLKMHGGLRQEMAGPPLGQGARRSAPMEHLVPTPFVAQSTPAKPPSPSSSSGPRGAESDDITSIMVCNIPCRVSQGDLVDLLETLGFGSRFDFLYLPTGGRPSSSSVSNLGYGFINFIDAQSTVDFSQAFVQYRFPGTSAKVCTVRPAHVQGLANNIVLFGRSAQRLKKRERLISPVVKLHDPVDRRVLQIIKDLKANSLSLIFPTIDAHGPYGALESVETLHL